jgi:hypothetical protein
VLITEVGHLVDELGLDTVHQKCLYRSENYCVTYVITYEVWLLNNETVLVENKPCCVS